MSLLGKSAGETSVRNNSKGPEYAILGLKAWCSISWAGNLAWLWLEGSVSLLFRADLTVDGFDNELCSMFSYISKKIMPIRKMRGKKQKKRNTGFWGGYFWVGRNWMQLWDAIEVLWRNQCCSETPNNNPKKSMTSPAPPKTKQN